MGGSIFLNGDLLTKGQWRSCCIPCNDKDNEGYVRTRFSSAVNAKYCILYN